MQPLSPLVLIEFGQSNLSQLDDDFSHEALYSVVEGIVAPKHFAWRFSSMFNRVRELDFPPGICKDRLSSFKGLTVKKHLYCTVGVVLRCSGRYWGSFAVYIPFGVRGSQNNFKSRREGFKY